MNFSKEIMILPPVVESERQWEWNREREREKWGPWMLRWIICYSKYSKSRERFWNDDAMLEVICQDSATLHRTSALLALRAHRRIVSTTQNAAHALLLIRSCESYATWKREKKKTSSKRSMYNQWHALSTKTTTTTMHHSNGPTWRSWARLIICWIARNSTSRTEPYDKSWAYIYLSISGSEFGGRDKWLSFESAPMITPAFFSRSLSLSFQSIYLLA